MSIDVTSLVALDVHVHAERNPGEEQDPVTGEILAAAAEYFGGHPPQPTAEEVADYYRERKHGGGRVHGRRRGRAWAASGSATTRCSRRPRRTRTC